MAQIFISYSKQDIEFARHLRTLLQEAGFDAWLDERLVPSTQWWRTLEKQIKASSALIVIMSPSAAESRWVEREILVAENANLPIFPVLLAGEGWSRLADIQYEDFTAALNAKLPTRFVEALRAVINGAAPTNTISRQPIKNTTSSQTESRLLESAMPAETKGGTDTEMWAKISLPDSAGLRSELPAVVPSGDVIQRDDARTTSFPFRFATNPQTGERLPAQVTLKASSADFIIRSPGGDDSEVIELPPDTDSRTVIFTLLPKPGARTSGRARVFLDLIHENKVIAQISVSTQLVEQVTRQPAGASPWGLWSVPVGSASAGASGYDTPGDARGGEVVVDVELPAGPPKPITRPRAPITQPSFESAEAELDDLITDEDARGGEADLDDWLAEDEAGPSSPVEQSREEVEKKSLPESEEADWRGAMPPTPFPPPTSPVSPSTTANETVPVGGVVINKPQLRPQPNVPTRTGRVINFPAISAIAGLALVFVIVITLVNNTSQTASLQTREASTSVAMSAITETYEAVIAIATSQSANGTELSPDPSTPSSSTPSPTGSIEATRLLYCETDEQANALFDLLDQMDMDYERLGGDTDDGVPVSIANAALAGQTSLIVWGICGISQRVSLYAELNVPPTDSGVLHPETIEINLPFDELENPESTAAVFIEAMAKYSRGEFDADLLNALAHVYDAIETDPSNSTGVMGFDLLLGNAHLLFNENDYEAALSRFGRVNTNREDAALIPGVIVAALNNAGRAEINHARAVDAGSEAFDTAVENAANYLDQAEARAQFEEQRRIIGLNRALLQALP